MGVRLSGLAKAPCTCRQSYRANQRRRSGFCTATGPRALELCEAASNRAAGAPPEALQQLTGILQLQALAWKHQEARKLQLCYLCPEDTTTTREALLR